MHNLFLVYFVNLYMFRAYLGPSSGGTIVCIQQLILIILFFLTVCCPGRIGTSSLYTQPRMWYESVGISYWNTSANRLQLGKTTRHFTRPEMRKNMCQIPVYGVIIMQSCSGYYTYVTISRMKFMYQIGILTPSAPTSQ